MRSEFSKGRERGNLLENTSKPPVVQRAGGILCLNSVLNPKNNTHRKMSKARVPPLGCSKLHHTSKLIFVLVSRALMCQVFLARSRFVSRPERE